ncbi:tyrosyl-DNA phosphodiesterase domain-containing protein [Byssothecium circinans]|uniref:Tyrosyl-DNA phosphodiesterase domain-containing protein n=1 Tax=Byssothecium circinans TaxID=147558 RepID=A0A6A5UA66_9PLEO|nr:tyrosyl-DNA phosphodiesterase domain-containing protein [Byssothecium circinans]
MASSDDDEEIKRAIAMSLADAASNDAVVDLTSDDEVDEDMRRALALSLGEPQGKTTHGASAQTQSGSSSSTETSKPSGILGLDRKAMEQERLERLGKRKRSVSPERPSKQVVQSDPKHESKKHMSTYHRIASASTGLEYPNGVVKRTWANKHPRSNDITIDEVLQASSLNIAILSAFQWDNPWLMGDHLDPYTVKQIWIMCGKSRGEDVRDKLRQEAKDANIPNFKMHFPPLPGQTQNMHGKLMLLFHKEGHLRVVVSTANMIKFDWGETNKDADGSSLQPGVMENTVFLIDLPRRPKGPAAELETEFGKSLVQYLKAQDVPSNVVEGVLKFDFSETKNIGFVHSIAGVKSGPERTRTGLPCLAKTIRNLKLDQIDKLEIDYVTSSLGALKVPLLEQIYQAARGLTPLTQPQTNVVDHFRIYFPTEETVVNSTGGPDCGGIITLNRGWYDAPTFPRQCFRDYKSTRPGMLSHNKLLFARGYKKDGTPVAWVYVGSANLSEAAWGVQKTLKSGKEAISLLRNWECGVVVPVPEEKLKAMPKSEVPPMSVFEGTVDVPFVYPGEKYGDREPWYYQRGEVSPT